MKFTIDDERVIAVVSELAWRLGVDEETIIRATLKELSLQYISKPTLAMQFVKLQLKKQGVI